MDKSAVEYKALALLEAAQATKGKSKTAANQVLLEANAHIWVGLPPVEKAVRQLAGQANAARGQSVLWLIRPAPKAQPPTRLEVDDWVQKLRQGFEGIPPLIEALDLVGPGGEPVMALSVETDRAPFVIYQTGGKAGSRKSVERPTEVLWQEAGVVRPIRRGELVRLVTPLRELPDFEILVGELSVYKNVNRMLDPRNAFHWSLDATVYVTPKDDKRLILPFRRAGLMLESAAHDFSSEANQINLSADRESTSISDTDSALLVNGLGQFYLFASGSTSREDPPLKSLMRLILTLTPSGNTSAAICTASLVPAPPKEDHQKGLWKLA